MSEQSHQCRCTVGSLVLAGYSVRCECDHTSCGSPPPCHLSVGPQVVCAVSNSRMVMESENQGSDVSELEPSEPVPPPHGMLGRRHSVDSNIGRTRPPTFIRTYREVKWRRVNHPGRLLLPRSAQLAPPAAPGLTEAESREYIDGTHIIRQRVPIFMTSCDPQGELGRRFSAGDLVPVTGLSQNWMSYGKCLFIRNSPPATDGSTTSSSYMCSVHASDKKRLDQAHDDDDRGFLMIDEDDEEDFTDDGSEEEDEDDEIRDRSPSNRDSGVCVYDFIDKLSSSCPTPASTILMDAPPASVPPARHSDPTLKTVPTDPGDLSRYSHDTGESWPLLSEQEDARSWAYSQAVGSKNMRLHVPSWVTTETASTPSQTQNAGKAVMIFGGLSATPAESAFTDGIGRPVLTQPQSGVSSPLSSESIFTDDADRPVFDGAQLGVSSPNGRGGPVLTPAMSPPISTKSVVTNGTGGPLLIPAMSSVSPPISTKSVVTNGTSRPDPAMPSVSSPLSTKSAFTNGTDRPVLAMSSVSLSSPISTKSVVTNGARMTSIGSKTDAGNGSVMMPAQNQPSTKPVLNKPGVVHPNMQPSSHVVATRATTVSSQMISVPCAIHRTNLHRPELPRPFVEDRSSASPKIAGTSVYMCTCRSLSSKTNGMSARAVAKPVPVNLEEAQATRVELVKISNTREGEPLLFQKVTYSSGSICCSAHWVAPAKVSTGSGVAARCPGVRSSSVPRPAAARTDLAPAEVSDGSFAVGKVGAARQPFLIISDLSRDVSLTLAAAATKGKYIVVKVTKDDVGAKEASQIVSASDTSSRFPDVVKDSNGCMNDKNYGATINFSAKSSVNTQPEQETACQPEHTQSQLVLSTSLSCDKYVKQDKSIVNADKHYIPQTNGTRSDEPDSYTGLSQKAILQGMSGTCLSQKSLLQGMSGTGLSQKAVLLGMSQPQFAASATESDCMNTTASCTPTTNQAQDAPLSSSCGILGVAPPGLRTDHKSANMPLSGVVDMQLDPQSQTDNTVNGLGIFHDVIHENSLTTNLLESNIKYKDCFTVTSVNLSSHASLDVEDQSSLSSRHLDKLPLSLPGDISYMYPDVHVRVNDRDRDSQISISKDVEVVENVDDGGLFTEDGGDLLPALIKDISEVENVQESSDRQAPDGGGGSTVAIDNKIEQAMDLVKRHLMYAVREEVEILKQQIGEMMERIGQLEYENTVLRSEARPETLNKLQQPRVSSAPVTAAAAPASATSSSQQPAVSSQPATAAAAAPVSAAPTPQPTQPSSQPPQQQHLQQQQQQSSTSQLPPPSAS